MPGEEQSTRWKQAWNIANSKNCRIRDDCYSPHFNVAPLLKSTTGLDMEHLSLLIKKQDEHAERVEEVNIVDREMAAGREASGAKVRMGGWA